MAKPVSVHIPHSLGAVEARRRIEEGFGLLQSQMSVGPLALATFNKRWEGDLLHFEGGLLVGKVTGRLEVLADAVRIEIDLPDLLATLAQRIADGLKSQTQKLLGKK